MNDEVLKLLREIKDNTMNNHMINDVEARLGYIEAELQRLNYNLEMEPEDE